MTAAAPTPPPDPRRSLITCRYAPRTFMFDRDDECRIAAAATLMINPATATPNIRPPSTGWGFRRRSVDSMMIATDISRSAAPFRNAARISHRRYPKLFCVDDGWLDNHAKRNDHERV